MAKQLPKPPAFIPGSKVISANALNELRQAIPSLLQGGQGISITPYGDKFIVKLAEAQGRLVSPIELFTVREISFQYLICDREHLSETSNSVVVAKPWCLRKGVNWPA